MAKKLTVWQRMEAVFILTLVGWTVIEIVSSVLSFTLRHWKTSLPLLIILIWCYIRTDGDN